ncbi:TPA: hypothetical protein EYP66_06460 [Candidatus Poribacteria bacterium]|nr:hypothetical protein [Candidatus Poribacteria bacterium]
MRGKIRKLRIRFAKNQYRVLYFFFRQNLIVLTRAFLKKTQKQYETRFTAKVFRH